MKKKTEKQTAKQFAVKYIRRDMTIMTNWKLDEIREVFPSKDEAQNQANLLNDGKKDTPTLHFHSAVVIPA